MKKLSLDLLKTLYCPASFASLYYCLQKLYRLITTSPTAAILSIAMLRWCNKSVFIPSQTNYGGKSVSMKEYCQISLKTELDVREKTADMIPEGKQTNLN